MDIKKGTGRFRTGREQTPPRIVPRMEGKVRNWGNRSPKKPKQR